MIVQEIAVETCFVSHKKKNQSDSNKYSENFCDTSIKIIKN